MNIFHLVLTKPLLNVLIWIYNTVPLHDIGIAIIVLTILVRLLLFPSFQKSLRSQRQLQQLQPKLDEIKEKYKDDKEAQTKAVLEFYQQNKVNPFSSCLPLLVQLPILIALYQVFLSGLNSQLAGELYPFVRDPGQINTNFLGLMDLSKANFIFAFLAGALQFVQSKLMMPTKKIQDQTAPIVNIQFSYLIPVVTVFIAAKLPAGLALYWIVATLFAIGQQYYIMKKQ